MGTKEGKDSNSQDAALFRDAMRDVDPIKPSRRVAEPKQPTRRRRPTGNEEPATQAQGSALGERLRYKQPHVSKAQMRALTSGKLRVAAAIDLHGLTAARGERELRSFLKDCISDRLTCVRVIHGKGFGSGSDGPVLKLMTDRHLRTIAEVEAFCSAPDHDGGTGATYVLLASGPRR
jgi:DNA-nicking Smr family endonuclease